jgi:hypothetical protein
MTSHASDSVESRAHKNRWIDPRLLAALVAMVTVPCAALLAVVAHLPQRILGTAVFLVGFLGPLVLLWNQNWLDGPMSDETAEAKPSQPVGDAVRSAKDSSSPEEEEAVSVVLAGPIKVVNR